MFLSLDQHELFLPRELSGGLCGWRPCTFSRTDQLPRFAWEKCQRLPVRYTLSIELTSCLALPGGSVRGCLLVHASASRMNSEDTFYFLTESQRECRLNIIGAGAPRVLQNPVSKNSKLSLATLAVLAVLLTS